MIWAQLPIYGLPDISILKASQTASLDVGLSAANAGIPPKRTYFVKVLQSAPGWECTRANWTKIPEKQGYANPEHNINSPFPISHFLFPILYFLFPIFYFLFSISHFLFSISIFYFPFYISPFYFYISRNKKGSHTFVGPQSFVSTGDHTIGMCRADLRQPGSHTAYMVRLLRPLRLL